ncbi:MAG TPA: hypothetical protein VEA81_17460 [Burkholderiaceae bacterium]|nr:hypothetical protein [Burkholderiaceae bacterium]
MQTTPGDAFRAPARPSAGGAAGGGDRPPADRLARPTAPDDARSPAPDDARSPRALPLVAILAVAAVVPTPWVVIPAIVAVAALQRAVSVIVHADRPAPAR